MLFDAPSDPGIDPLIGKVFDGRYRVESLLGQGGMGAVYKAIQIAMNKTVAVKVVRSELASNVEAARRFHREAKAASRLSHPHTIRVFDFGQTKDRELFMVMEYLDGRSLSELLAEEGRIPAARVAKIGGEIVQALIDAHELGFIHRDLKPDNVMLLAMPRDPEFVKVLDFGIVKFLSGSSGDSAMTRTGAVIGTPQYMAPEQARASRHLSTATDIYALGIIFYRMLSGQLPFTGETPVEVLMAQVTEAVPPLPDDTGIPDTLRELVLRMLRKEPKERPGAEDVLDTLEAIRYADIARRYTEVNAADGSAREAARSDPDAADSDTDPVEHPTAIDTGEAPSRDEAEDEAPGVARHGREGEPSTGDSIELALPPRGLVSRNTLWWSIAGLAFAIAVALLVVGGSGDRPSRTEGARADAGALIHADAMTRDVAGGREVDRAAETKPAVVAADVSERVRDAVTATDVVPKSPAPEPGPTLATESAPKKPKPAPSPRPRPRAAKSKAVAREPVKPTPAVKPPAPARPPAATPAIQVHFTSTPSGARVYQGSRKLGTTPFTKALPERTGLATFVCRKTGYHDRQVRFEGGYSRKVSCSLEPLDFRSVVNKAHPRRSVTAAISRSIEEPLTPFARQVLYALAAST
jgi:serine/threonine protein kinase